MDAEIVAVNVAGMRLIVRHKGTCYLIESGTGFQPVKIQNANLDELLSQTGASAFDIGQPDQERFEDEHHAARWFSKMCLPRILATKRFVSKSIA